MTRGGFETGRTLVDVTVDMNVSKFPVLEAGLMIVGVVTSEGCVMITTDPPGLGASDSNLFFLGQSSFR